MTLPPRPESCAPDDAEHEARLGRALTRDLEGIPFYAKRRAACVADGAPVAARLAATPLLFKHEVRATLPRDWVPAGRDLRGELASGDLELVETSGSTGDRTRVLWDRGWWLRQEERGMRTNALIDRAMGDADRYREAILTTPVCGLGACHTGDMTFEERRDGHRIFLNSRADPTFWRDGDAARMLDELERHDTVGLEADPAYLAALARHATATGRTLAVSEFVTLTYAMCSAAHRRSFTSAVLAPRFELYGASEVGVLFMQGDGPLLEHCPETTHVELVPVLAETPGADAVAVVVVSTLDRAAQPLVRFVLGDLVCVAQGAQGAFTSVPPLASLEGRFQDAIVRPDGAWVTAGAVDRALAGLTSLATYQANQPDPKTVVVDVVAEAGAPASLCDDVVERLAALAGGMKVSARLVTAVPAEASGKFRLARRHFLVDLGALFAGGAGVAG